MTYIRTTIMTDKRKQLIILHICMLWNFMNPLDFRLRHCGDVSGSDRYDRSVRLNKMYVSPAIKTVCRSSISKDVYIRRAFPSASEVCVKAYGHCLQRDVTAGRRSSAEQKKKDRECCPILFFLFSFCLTWTLDPVPCLTTCARR